MRLTLLPTHADLDWQEGVREVRTMQNIAQIVADAFGVSVSELKGEGRSRSITYPRQEAMARIKDLLPHISASKIGKFFNRDHTTVQHGVAAARRRGPCDRVDHLLRLQA